jgi:excisionase family DNA binding protein
VSRLAAVQDLPAEPADRFLTLQEKARQLAISLSHLRRLVEAGRVEAIDLTMPGSKRRVLRFKA